LVCPILIFLPFRLPLQFAEQFGSINFFAGGHLINGTFDQVSNICITPTFLHHLYIIQGRRIHFRYSFSIFNFKIFEKNQFEKTRNLIKCPILGELIKCPLDQMSPHLFFASIHKNLNLHCKVKILFFDRQKALQICLKLKFAKNNIFKFIIIENFRKCCIFIKINFLFQCKFRFGF
jgi:hypothetical protein